MANIDNAPAPERRVGPAKGLAGRFHADFLNLCGVLVALFITVSDAVGPLVIGGVFLALLIFGVGSLILVALKDHIGALDDQQHAQSKPRLKTIFRVSLMEAVVFAIAVIATVIIVIPGFKEKSWGSEILAPLAFAVAILVCVQVWFYYRKAKFTFKHPVQPTRSLARWALVIFVDIPIILGILAVAGGAAWSGGTAISTKAHVSSVYDVPALLGAAGWLLIELVSGIQMIFTKTGRRSGPQGEDWGAKSPWPRWLSLTKSGLQIFGMACLITLVTLAESHKYFQQNPALFWLGTIAAALGTIVGMTGGIWNFYDNYMKKPDAAIPLDDMAGQSENDSDTEESSSGGRLSRRRHRRRQTSRRHHHKKRHSSDQRKRSLSRFW